MVLTSLFRSWQSRESSTMVRFRVLVFQNFYLNDPALTCNECDYFSAGKPKKPGALITFCLMLGPDFISDSIVVETSDHARLRVAVAMNNVFRVSIS